MAVKQKQSLEAGPKEKDIIGSMQHIIVASEYKKKGNEGRQQTFYKFDDSLIESVESDAIFLAEQFHITPKQAVLLTLILNIGQGESVSYSTLFDKTEMDYIKAIPIKVELRALEKAMLIIKSDRNYIISREVNYCIEKNQPYIKPGVSNLSTANILSRMSQMFKTLENQEGDSVIFMHQIDEMLLANPGTSIAKTADKYHILKAGSEKKYYYDGGVNYNQDYLHSVLPMERMLFYSLCYLYDRQEDDFVRWYNVSDFMESNVIYCLRDAYRMEMLTLQKNGVLEYANENGVKTKDHFKIADSVKEEIFADCGGLHESTPISGIILNQDIVSKELFFDDEISRQVNTLSKLLSEERYDQIRSALTAKGMRTGFACLLYGSPGTGKTETVYQLARNTGRDIIMVDVSRLKSCWVGESEKNFKSLFSRYRRLVRESKVTPILLFNEADAIFGIRQSGAERAVDKMENSLQNILLQEMEDLQGILIATTNLTDNLDKAFERRFLYKIQFKNPSYTIRSKIWQSMMPELSETDIELLSNRYEFSGGQIENIIRKMNIHSILKGVDAGINDIVEFCNEERINTTSKIVIGF